MAKNSSFVIKIRVCLYNTNLRQFVIHPSLPRSFPAKAFKYSNRRANEFFRGKPSRRFHFLEVRVVFILSVLAGFSIFWSGSTSWICFRLFSALRWWDFWRQQTLFPWECHGELLRRVFLFKK